ncbi:MAG: hypothetical protein ACK5MS_20875 [Planctomyces sp.]
MLIPEKLSVHDEREREKVQAEVSMLPDLENCTPQICALRQMFLPSEVCCTTELKELPTDARLQEARLNDLPDGQNLNSITEELDRLRRRLDELKMAMLEPLAARCTVIVRSLLGWLQGKGIIKKSQLNDPKLLAITMAHLLLTGRCRCGEDQERLQRLHKQGSKCQSDHRLSGWDVQGESLNHFLLRALLGHTFGSDLNLTEESQVQKVANFALNSWSPRELANGMLLDWVQPNLEAVLIPVCRRCGKEVSLNNVCGCTLADPSQTPHVVDPTWRLVPQQQRQQYRPLSMYRISRTAGGSCVHGGDNQTAKLVFPAVPLPFVKADDRPKKSSGPTCPYCHLPLGNATEVDFRIAEAEKTDVATIEDGGGLDLVEDKRASVLTMLQTAVSANLERDDDAAGTRAALRCFQEQARGLFARYYQLTAEEFEEKEEELADDVRQLGVELKKKSRKAAEVLASRMRPKCEGADDV